MPSPKIQNGYKEAEGKCESGTDQSNAAVASDDMANQSLESADRKGKPMKARVRRFSTIRAQHHVEEYQVDFPDPSSEEEEEKEEEEEEEL
jgi:hypothetical protein